MLATAHYLSSIPLNKADISTASLNIENKERSNFLPWNGQFSPQFVEAVLERYANTNTKILDPFCGSGTVLSEAARLGIHATGIEVNPAAYILANTYSLCNLKPEIRCLALNNIELRLQNILPNGWPLFTSIDIKPACNYQHELVNLRNTSTNIEKIILESLIILADFFRGVDSRKLAKTWGKLRNIIEELPHNINHIDVHHGDGRFQNYGIDYDLILTSPPYINVYNYHQQYRASAESLGWNLLEVAKSEIGSNRKNRGNRFLTVIQYCLDLALTMRSLWFATSKDAKLIFVLGRESKVRGIPFLNGEITARLAIDAVGYRLVMRQERVFTNKFGKSIYEDILHLEKGEVIIADSQARARIIAESVLIESLIHPADDEVKNDLHGAIEKVSGVSSSPRFMSKHPQIEPTRAK
jgi:16S rRNA G966 N2-methylase RsmD